jgi:hypothetical protein
MAKSGVCCGADHVRRRDFLRVGSLTFLGINLSQYLELKQAVAQAKVAAAPEKAQACILVWLDGGPSQMDTWDPKPNSAFKPISTKVPGVQISELFPKIAQHMDKLAIIRSMYTKEQNHPQGTHYVATGHSPNPAMQFPGFGAIITKEMGPRNHVPPHVMVPAMPKGKSYDEYFKAHFLGAQYDPMILPDPSQKDFQVPDLSLPAAMSVKALEDRRSFLNIVDKYYRRHAEAAEFAKLDSFREQAWNMILAPEVKAAFDLSQESDKDKDRYGRTPVGQSLLLARRLVEAGSRFVTAGGYKSQAWDTHKDNNRAHKDDLGPPLDQAFSALMEDLEKRGLLESTIVLVLGEFGRTPHINPDGGRDHWAECWSILIGGGGLKSGLVVGSSDERGAYVADRLVSMGDVFATIYKAFGIDWTKEYMHPIGRPLKIANALNDQTGKPLSELI